jgi:vacuolar-type H+-ATPase subunit H
MLSTPTVSDVTQLAILQLRQELDRLEEILVADSPRVPLSGRVLVNEQLIFAQLDHLRHHLPAMVLEAEQVLQRREEILRHAQAQAQQIVLQAEQQAARILDQHRITVAELQHLRQQTQEELAQQRQHMEAERQRLIQGAQNYANQVLTLLEQVLGENLQRVQQGRHQLQQRHLP